MPMRELYSSLFNFSFNTRRRDSCRAKAEESCERGGTGRAPAQGDATKNGNARSVRPGGRWPRRRLWRRPHVLQSNRSTPRDWPPTLPGLSGRHTASQGAAGELK
eukprot:scaffold26288_cov111-Isochrysis_galbana.AAC.16